MYWLELYQEFTNEKKKFSIVYWPDNYEWMKIEYDGKYGWISTYDFDYNTGI